jgi:RNA polymerase sigma-70 factor (ECF subfamily)
LSSESEKDKLVAQEPDITLVKRASQGDAESFTELAARYYPAMVAIAHSITGDRDLAEDAAQQCFARAAVKLLQLKDYRKFASWLAAICRNAAKDIAGQENNRCVTADLSGIEIKSERDDSCEVVKDAISKLSAPAREVIYLRYYDGLSYEQISAVLGISGQAINGRLRRAKKQLAQILGRVSFKQV